MKFPDEAVFCGAFSDEEKRKLIQVFCVSDSGSDWRRALILLGLKSREPTADLIKFYKDAPYFNWSCLLSVISGGALQAVGTDSDGYSVTMDYRPLALLRFISSQWKIARFLHRLPENEDNKIAYSLALGLALQSLVMRLGSSNAQNIASWLATPEDAPAKHKKTLAQIQAVQMRRTIISSVWKDLFPDLAGKNTTSATLPEYFWDDMAPPAPGLLPQEETPARHIWKGLPVCQGKRKGLALVVTRETTPQSFAEIRKTQEAPLILVFRQARPETTEFFEYAAALIFAEGGALSHACTVARARSIPSVTGLGQGFYAFVCNNPPVWLEIDGSAGTVKILSGKSI